MHDRRDCTSGACFDILASSSAEEYFMEDAQLAAEFRAWDTLSDEALEVFERQLEETE